MSIVLSFSATTDRLAANDDGPNIHADGSNLIEWFAANADFVEIDMANDEVALVSGSTSNVGLKVR